MKKLVMLCEILGITEEMLMKVVKGEAKLTYIEDIQGVKNAVHKLNGLPVEVDPANFISEQDRMMMKHYMGGDNILNAKPQPTVEKWSEVISSENHVEEVTEEVVKEGPGLVSTEAETNKVSDVEWVPQKFNLETKKFEGWGEIKDTTKHGSEDITNVIPELMDDEKENESETAEQPTTEVVTETTVASTQSAFWGTTPKKAEVDEHSPKEVSSVSSNPWMSNTWETVK